MPRLLKQKKGSPYDVAHHAALVPITGIGSNDDGVPGNLTLQYYTQRASEGALLITEATSVSASGITYVGAPGIYTDAQVNGWKRLTDAVHARGARIFLLLSYAGRSAHTDTMIGGLPIAASAIALDKKTAARDIRGNLVKTDDVPRALTLKEIQAVVGKFRLAAERARAAGFDGVELQATCGSLFDQFLHDGSNLCTDTYGGSIENRARFVLEIVDGLVRAWGGNRVSIRISSRGKFGAMADGNPATMLRYIAEQLNRYGLAFLHIIESRNRRAEDVQLGAPGVTSRSLCGIFKGAVLASGGGCRRSARSSRFGIGVIEPRGDLTPPVAD